MRIPHYSDRVVEQEDNDRITVETALARAIGRAESSGSSGDWAQIAIALHLTKRSVRRTEDGFYEFYVAPGTR